MSARFTKIISDQPEIHLDQKEFKSFLREDKIENQRILEYNIELGIQVAYETIKVSYAWFKKLKKFSIERELDHQQRELTSYCRKELTDYHCLICIHELWKEWIVEDKNRAFRKRKDLKGIPSHWTLQKLSGTLWKALQQVENILQQVEARCTQTSFQSEWTDFTINTEKAHTGGARPKTINKVVKKKTLKKPSTESCTNIHWCWCPVCEVERKKQRNIFLEDLQKENLVTSSGKEYCIRVIK